MANELTDLLYSSNNVDFSTTLTWDSAAIANRYYYVQDNSHIQFITMKDKIQKDIEEDRVDFDA